jgi:hypothetical protein
VDTGIRECALDINPVPTGPVFNRSFFARKGNFCIEKMGVLKCGLLPPVISILPTSMKIHDFKRQSMMFYPSISVIWMMKMLAAE